MKLRLLLVLSLLGACLCRLAHAHIRDNFDSVHFNSGSPDFGELPRRAVMPSEVEVRSSFDGWDQDDDRDSRKQELSPEARGLRVVAWERRERSARLRAREAEAGGDWSAARAIYCRLAGVNGWSGDLRDRVALLSDISEANRGVQRDEVRAYMRALDLLGGGDSERWTSARKLLVGITRKKRSDPILAPHALYQLASLDYGWLEFHDAVSCYAALLRAYPKASVTESALIMLARAAILPATSPGRDVGAGRKALAELARAFPHSRFRRSALGLQARLDFLDGHYARAVDEYFRVDDLESVEIVRKRVPAAGGVGTSARLLAGYLRRLGRADDYDRFVRAVEDVRRTIAYVDGAEARIFLAELSRNPSISAPYFYFRLYHCDNTPADVASLARVARGMATSVATGGVSPTVEVRFAEVFYAAGRYREALFWAGDAQKRSATHFLDRAAFVIGASQLKLRLYRESRATFANLLSRAATSPLAFAAREEKALACEALGDLAGALDQYFVLDYRADIAYMLDVRMSIREVEAYGATCRSGKRRSLCIYSTGIRYLRAGNWQAARDALETLPRATFRKSWDMASDDESGTYAFDENPQNPLKTIRDLSRLDSAARRRGISRNARASALYAYASYYYKHGTLLLYNLAAWQGSRALDFDFEWNNEVASPSDIAAVRAHMYEHEVYARTEAICRRLARDYPDSPTAPYALYRGACAATRLAGLNGWWRAELRHHDHYKEAANMMSALAHRYPRHPLAREAWKFAHVFGDDAASMAEERRRYEEYRTTDGSHYRSPGWFP